MTELTIIEIYNSVEESELDQQTIYLIKTGNYFKIDSKLFLSKLKYALNSENKVNHSDREEIISAGNSMFGKEMITKILSSR